MDATPRSHTSAAARRRPLALLLAGLLAPGAALASPASDALLSQVPADTAYLLFSDGSLPEVVRRAQWQRAALQLRMAREALDAPPPAPEGKQAQPPADDRLKRALLDTLLAAVERGDGDLPAGLGFAPTDPWAVYADGLLPVARARVSRPDVVRTVIADLGERSGKPWTRQQVGEAEVWLSDADDRDARGHLLVALEGDRLVAGVVPRRGRAAAIRRLLDDAPARAPFAGSERLAALQGTLGITTTVVFDIDSARIVEQLAAEPDGRSRALFDIDAPVIEANCIEDARRLARAWPGLSGGYVSIEGRQASSVGLLRTGPDIASDLAGLPGPAPAWPAEAGAAPLQVRLSLDATALAAMIGRQLQGSREQPWTCPSMASLNQLPAQWQQASPGVIMATSLVQGLWFGMADLPREGAQEVLPDAALAVSSANPSALLGLMQGFDPSLAALAPVSGGPAIPVTAGGAFGGAHLALGEGGVAVGSGEAWVPRLPALAGPPGPADGRLLDLAITQPFMALVARRQAEEIQPEKGTSPAETERRRREASAEATLAADTYEAIRLGLRPHAGGLLFEQHETFR